MFRIASRSACIAILLVGPWVAVPAAPPRPAAVRCADDQVSRSLCMIRIILDDVQRHNGKLSGGGISDIRALSSDSYRVSLPHEERIVIYTYRFTLGRGLVRLLARKEDTRTM